MPLYRTDLVQPNKYSRPQLPLLDVRGIVVHYTANPGASASNHADFFDGSDGGGKRAASAHIFVDKLEAILIVPLDEVAYHANEKACRIAKLRGKSGTYQGDANVTTIGLEMCVEKDGTIHHDTVVRTVAIVAVLCKQYKLDVNDVYRHYDVTGKICPKPFVENAKMWDKFKQDVANLLRPPVKPKPPGKPPVSTPQATGKVHLVKPGDTLSEIAQRYKTSVDKLSKINNIKDPSKISVGQKIRI